MAVSSGYKIEFVVRGGEVEAFGRELDELTVAIAAFEIVPGGAWRIEAYTVEEPDADALKAALDRAATGLGIGIPGYHVAPLPPVDWLAENRRAFPPQSLARYFIHGSHFTGRVPPGRVGVLVDAATAFGSGEHETTRGCLLSLDRLARRRSAFRRHPRALDIGCGSGILAIAIAKTWPIKVMAGDLDAESVRVTRENARLNHVAARLQATRANGYRARTIQRGRPYDIVTSNILARPLCALSRDLGRALSRRGVAILSGLLVEQESQVLAAHRRQGLALVRRARRSGWSTLLLARPGLRRSAPKEI